MEKIRTLIRDKQFPYVTVGLIVLNVVYFIIIALNGSPGNSVYMLTMGAESAPFVFEKHEYWRLITSMFMHFSFTHLAGNMLYVGIVGFSYERIVGHWKFLLIYMLSGIGGNVVSCAYYQITGQRVVSGGASGAVYGLIAMVIYLMFTARKRIGSQQMLTRIGIMLVFLFYSNFSRGASGVDVAAHIGGLIFGLILCILFLPVRKKKK